MGLISGVGFAYREVLAACPGGKHDIGAPLGIDETLGQWFLIRIVTSINAKAVKVSCFGHL